MAVLLSSADWRDAVSGGGVCHAQKKRVRVLPSQPQEQPQELPRKKEKVLHALVFNGQQQQPQEQPQQPPRKKEKVLHALVFQMQMQMQQQLGQLQQQLGQLQQQMIQLQRENKETQQQLGQLQQQMLQQQRENKEKQQQEEQWHEQLELRVARMEIFFPEWTCRGLAAVDVLDMLLKALDNELLNCVTDFLAKDKKHVQEFKAVGLKVVEELITFSELQRAVSKNPGVQWLQDLIFDGVSRLRAHTGISDLSDKLQENLSEFLRAVKPLRILGAHAMNLYAYNSGKGLLRSGSKLSKRKLVFRTLTGEEMTIKRNLANELQVWLLGGEEGQTDLEASFLHMKGFLHSVLLWYKRCLNEVQPTEPS